MSDGRAHRRLSNATMLVSYTIGAEFAAARTETYDIGLGGLAMFAQSDLPPGLQLTLELELRGDAHPPLALTAEVRWSRYDPVVQRFRTGVEFTNRTAEIEAELLRYIDTMYKLRDLGVL